MEWIEVTGKTLADAVELALDRLGVVEEELEYEVLDVGKTGLFRRNPKGRWGLRAISSSLVVVMNEHQLLLAPRSRHASPIGDSHAISDSGH